MVNYKDPEIRARHSLHLDVAQFHHKFGLLMSDTPTHLTKRKLQERFECMLEELTEFRDAANIDNDEPQNMELMADAIVDLVYFAMGTSVMMGLPFGDLWADVHAANMRKIRGISHRGHAVDCVKPAGWVGPQGHQILVANGYTGYSGELNCLDDADRLNVSEVPEGETLEPVVDTSTLDQTKAPASVDTSTIDEAKTEDLGGPLEVKHLDELGRTTEEQVKLREAAAEEVKDGE